MRLVITTNVTPALWRFSMLLAGSLASEHRAQVLLVALGPAPTPVHLADLPVGRPGGGEVEFEALSWPLEAEQADEAVYGACRDALLQLALRWHAQVLHAHEHHLGLLAAQGLPVVVVSHDDLYRAAAARGEDRRMIPAGYRHRVAAGLRSAALVVVTRAPAVQALSSGFGFSGVVRVIPNGIPPPKPTAPATRDIAALALCEDAAALPYLTGITASLPETATRRPGGPEPTAGSDRFPLSGPLPDNERSTVLARVRLCIDPSPRAALGLEHLDAALAGCALALSAHPEHRWLWEDDVLYFTPSSADSVREVLARAAADPAAIEARATRARARALARYTLERMAGSYARTYQRVALRYGISF
jgi:glycosyltransferase involved in cell wall biosynthesis